MFIKEISVTKPGWSKILLLAGASTTIGSSLCVGFHIGVVNTPADIIKTFCNESIHSKYNVDLSVGALDFLWSSIVSIFLVGAAIGSLGGSVLADKTGRKGSLIISSVLGAIGGLLFVISKSVNSVETIILGRLLVGLSSGLITSVMPMYLTELAPLHLRGTTGVLCPLGVTSGVLVAQILSVETILGNESQWPFLLGCYLVPLILCGAAMPVLPESPKYLYVIKKQHHLALKQLCKIRNTTAEFLADEVRELKQEEEDNTSSEGKAWTIGKALRSKELLMPLLLVISLQAGQQLSGINAVFYYSSKIFLGAGLSRESSELATIGAGVCNLLMAILSIRVMAMFDRRTVLQISLSTTAFFLVLLGVAISNMDAYKWMPYVSILGIMGFVVCYGIALGPIPYFIGSELFEVGPRPVAMALGSMANWGGNFFVGLLFPIMQNGIGAASFYIFAFIVVLLYIFTRIYLPETRGKDPSEVAHLCKDGFSSKLFESPISSSGTEETFPISEVKNEA
ncbi:solute carrier family 2, facilitated glucose transporter member 1-like isoform X2 [Aethina tumida]|uniref:solute carrier family 2, facilitated glucose transporter member 1-like isoform X2 n=1 Tax=Aethina tumida TaxID=116153 RepID=UPI00214925DC|nr:solute carrier family 2, facilitated glucose transporter member 1-like isoform X2 [Aethina tumida]